MSIIHSADRLLSLAERGVQPRRPVSLPKAAAAIGGAAVILKYRDRVDPEIKRRLRQREVYERFNVRFEGRTYGSERDNCSDITWAIGKALRDAGASPNETLAAVQETIFWRDRERRRKAEDPDRFISRLFANTPLPLAEAIDWCDPAIWFGMPVPEREWFVPELFPMAKASGLYGDGGTGKTTLAIQLMVSGALGLPFLGYDVRKGRVMGFLAENDDTDTHRALAAILHAEGMTFADLKGKMLISSRVGFDNIFMTFSTDHGKATELFEVLLRQIKAFGPMLVVLDTAADLFGGNENDRLQVRRFIADCCGRIAVETGAAVVLCAHPSQTGLRTGEGSGGSTAWNNTLRSRLFLRRDIRDGEEMDFDVRVLELRKANNAQIGTTINLRWCGGRFVVDDALRALKPLSDNEVRVIAEVRRAYDEGEPWSAHPQADARWLGTWIVNHLKKSRHSAKILVNSLISKGKIKNIEFNLHRHQTAVCTAEQALARRAKKSR